MIILFTALVLGSSGAQEASEGAPADEMASASAVSGSVVMGKNTYRSYCSSCHGAEGKGDGSLASVLTVTPTNLTRLAAENGGIFPAERVSKVIDGRQKVKGHGNGEMPAWGDAFAQIESSEEAVQVKIGQLVSYLESIQE